MALQTALAAQIGFKHEVTVGTALTPVTDFVPLISEDIKQEIEQMKSKGIIAGRRSLTSAQHALGNRTISGPVQMELYNRGQEILFDLMFGTPSKVPGPPIVRTYTMTDLAGVSATCQVGRPTITSGVVPFTFAGAKCKSFEIGCSTGEFATLGCELVGMTEVVTTPTLSTATYPAGMAPYTFVQGVVTVAGTSTNVKNATIKGDLGLDVERRFLGIATIAEALEADLRVMTIDLDCEFESLVHYNKFTAGTEVAVTLTFTAGTDVLALTANAYYAKTPDPNVGGKGIVRQMLSLECVASGADPTAFTAVMTNQTP